MGTFIEKWRSPVQFGMVGERWHVHTFVIGYTIAAMVLGYLGAHL